MTATNAMTWGKASTMTWGELKSGYTWGGAGGVPVGMQDGMVTVGASSATGAIWVAPEGTAFPRSAKEARPDAFKLLGFTSDAGVRVSESGSDTAIRAWEERTEVADVRTEYTEQVAFTPIQCNQDVLELTWGAGSVEAADGVVVARHHGRELAPVCLIVETVPREDVVRRYCLTAQLVERGEQALDGTQVDARELTFRSVPDAYGVTMVEYSAWLLSVDGGAPALRTAAKAAARPARAADQPNAGGMYDAWLDPFEPSEPAAEGEGAAELDEAQLAYLAEVWPEAYGPRADEQEDQEEV